MILLQVFSHCAFMLSLPGFVYVFYFSYTVQPRKTKVIFTTTPPYNLPILFLPLCLLSVSLASPISFIPLTQPSLLQIPTVPPYTTHKLPSHLPYLRYTMHTHYHLTMPTPTPLYMFHQLRTYTTTTDGTHTGHASLFFFFSFGKFVLM